MMSVTQTQFGKKVVTTPPQWIGFTANAPVWLWMGAVEAPNAPDQPKTMRTGRMYHQEIISTQLKQLHEYVYNRIVELLDDESLTMSDICAKMNDLLELMQEDSQSILKSNFAANLKACNSHIQFVQEQRRMNVAGIISDKSLFVSDIKEKAFQVFCALQGEVEEILNAHLVQVEGANEWSNAEMDRIEEEVRQMSAALEPKKAAPLEAIEEEEEEPQERG